VGMMKDFQIFFWCKLVVNVINIAQGYFPVWHVTIFDVQTEHEKVSFDLSDFSSDSLININNACDRSSYKTC
jgi:hypothetical protein